MIKLLNDNEFDESFKLIKSVFEIHKNIPNQVFKKQFSSFMFEEFDWAMSADFWNSFLKPMGVISQDDRILMAVLDPDPLNYFYNEFGYYNFVKFPINISGNKYFEALEQGPKNSPADAMLFNSEVVVWVPLSAKWAIWGKRGSGVIKLAFSDEITKKEAADLIKSWEQNR